VGVVVIVLTLPFVSEVTKSGVKVCRDGPHQSPETTPIKYALSSASVPHDRLLPSPPERVSQPKKAS
jgi:hypothetical protein